MAILKISKGIALNASHIYAIHYTKETDQSVIEMNNRTSYTASGNWNKHWLNLLKSGAVWSNGERLEYRK